MNLEVSAFVNDCWRNRARNCSWQLRWVNEVDNTVEKRVLWLSREGGTVTDIPRLQVTYDE